MTLISFSPTWFYGYDVFLEAGFAIAALIIAIFSFSLYKKTDQKQIRLFGIAFLLIAISYIIQSVLNFLTISQTDTYVCNVLNMQSMSMFGVYAIFAHTMFMTSGLVLLAYMTFKIEKIRILWLMLAISFIAIVFSASPLYSFFLISSILLAIILWYYISNYLQSRQTTTLLVVLAFAFLLFGSLHFMLSVDHELYYVIGHVLEFFAYTLILANLYLVRSHGKKT